MSGINNSPGGNGIGFAGLLTIVFVVLKLTSVINWSWWWVLSPLWISFGLGLVILAITGIVILCMKAKQKQALEKRTAERAARNSRRITGTNRW